MIKQISINNQTLDLSNVVKTTHSNTFYYNQTIESGQPSIILKNVDITKPNTNNTSSENGCAYSLIQGIDNSSNRTFLVEHRIDENLKSCLRIATANFKNINEDMDYIELTNDGGKFTFYGSTSPNNSANNTEYATTKWVRDLLSRLGLL